MSEAHAVLEAECAACHVQTAGMFSAKASDAACLSCHDGPIHHAAKTNAVDCATCHAEHRGRVNLIAAKKRELRAVPRRFEDEQRHDALRRAY